MNRNGFTLVELITALVLFGIVGTSIYQLLVNNQRVYQQQAERVGVNSSVRAAISILPNEIRELSAADPAGGDILSMGDTALTYKAMRSFYYLCQPPNTGSMQITLDVANSFGSSPLSSATDSIVLFAEGDSTIRSDDGWLHANVVSTTTGTACPGGAASITATIAGPTVAQLTGVQDGAPIRGFWLAQVLLYADAGGEYWLGGRYYNKSGSWGAVQVLVGPLSSSGMSLTYYDAAGAVTATPANVVRIAIGIESQSDLVRGGTGTQNLLQDLVTQIALRNNPLY